MTLYTSDYLEYYLTLVGWIVSNGIWHVLVASGVFALPFLAIIIREWLRARAEGADEGNKGVLSSLRIENRVWVAIVVILFAGIPYIQLDLSILAFDRSRSIQCQIDVPLPSETDWATSFTTLNDQSAQVPVWWFFMHSLSKAITGAAVATIPCGTDLRQIRMDIDSTRIDDPVLAQEVADFTHDCYGPSRAKLFMNRPTLGKDEMNDINWIGSSYFLETPGFYDTYHSTLPRPDWPYDTVRDAGFPEVVSGGPLLKILEKLERRFLHERQPLPVEADAALEFTFPLNCSIPRDGSKPSAAQALAERCRILVGEQMKLEANKSVISTEDNIVRVDFSQAR